MKKQFKLLKGNNMETLKQIPDNSIDSIVTDPPYGLSFMNKKWDYDVPSVEFWKEAYRVLKPGGHILSFGGTRTYHRMVVNIEDAGFEIRDQIMWIYGSGFPKSHNIGKAVDKKEGNKREVVGLEKGAGSNKFTDGINGLKPEYELTKGNSEYEGWGTALKPANEPICVARKPLSEKTVADNVLKWGTGGINIDGCRVEYTNGSHPKDLYGDNYMKSGFGKCNNELQSISGKERNGVYVNDEGRFPANIIFECICDEVIKGDKGEIVKRIENTNGSSFGSGTNKTDYNDTADIHTNPNCPCFQLDEQSGVSKSRSKYPDVELQNMPMNYYDGEKLKHIAGKEQTKEFISDKGGASRFFYVAKVSKKERNLGLDSFEDKEVKKTFDGCYNHNEDIHNKIVKNTHPTLKPIKLMSYLIRLVTPENGVVLDPFMGSGSTGIAAMLEGKRFVGCELDEEYFKIAEKRIEEWKQYKQIIK